jgi:transcriptional regulator with XRE-family HTH domain
MNFGVHLKRLRKEAKLTQSQLARKCGLSDAYLNRVEKQTVDPPTRRVCQQLARALGADGNELWKRAFTARLERWLKKEGFKKVSQDSLLAMFESLTSKE